MEDAEPNRVQNKGCIESGIQLFVDYFFWLCLGCLLSTLFVILTDSFSESICVFVGLTSLLFLISLRLISGSYINDLQSERDRQLHFMSALRTTYNSHRISSFRRYTRAELNWELQDEEEEALRDDYLGLPQKIINLLPCCQYKRTNSDNKLTCVICYDEALEGQEILTLPCFHQFHRKCIGTWLQQRTTCPICKIKIKSYIDRDNIS